MEIIYGIISVITLIFICWLIYEIIKAPMMEEFKETDDDINNITHI